MLLPGAFLEFIVRSLLPYFYGITPDEQTARTEILSTLASYNTRTRAEMLNAAQIIAFGMTTLDVLADVKATGMSASMRLRHRGCANGLNRSGQQNEHTLSRRLASELPPPSRSQREPVDDIPDEDAEAIMQSARDAIETYRNRASGPGAAASPHAASLLAASLRPKPVATALTPAPHRQQYRADLNSVLRHATPGAPQAGV